MNVSKTKVLAYNMKNAISLTTKCGSPLDQVQDFQYLGSWVDESEKDFNVRKALAWKACNKMHSLWKSNLSSNFRFVSSVRLLWKAYSYMGQKAGRSLTI